MSLTFAEMAQLHAACFTTPRPWTAVQIAQTLASPHSFALSRPQGFMIGTALLDEAELLTLAVDPAARRQGIGRDLLGEFCTFARQKGAARAFLDVAADNSAALALYAAAGFAQTGLRRGYYKQPDGAAIDAVLMTCLL